MIGKYTQPKEVKTLKYKHAVYIGRFQPIHRAHLESIKIGLEQAEHLILFIGSAKRHPDLRNPWSYDTRKKFIQDAIKEYFGEPKLESWSDKPNPSILDRVTILPVRDYLYNNNKWVSEVFAKATSVGASPDPRDTVLIGGMKDDTSFYLKMFPKWHFEQIPMLYDRLSSVNIRKNILISGYQDELHEYVVPSTASFLKEWYNSDTSTHIRESWAWHVIHWAQFEGLKYAPHFVTADCLVVKSGCVLLVKRGFHPGKGLWALPGGYLNVNETLRECALRELKEETKISVPKNVLDRNIESVRVFDHPNRSLRGRIVTHVHFIDLGWGDLPTVKAADDAAEAHWVPIADVNQMEDQFFEDHSDIIYSFTSTI